METIWSQGDLSIKKIDELYCLYKNGKMIGRMTARIPSMVYEVQGKKWIYLGNDHHIKFVVVYVKIDAEHRQQGYCKLLQEQVLEYNNVGLWQTAFSVPFSALGQKVYDSLGMNPDILYTAI